MKLFQLKPVEVLGPMWKKFIGLGRLLPSEMELNRKEVAPSTLRSEHSSTKEQPPVKCVSGGKVYNPEDTWISENQFTKKCTSDGSVIILNCLIDDKVTINVDTELKVGRNTYKCYRKKSEGRVFYEVVSQ
ncbi:hypothetical protein RB195_012657 [Necator americanus]|uniref:Abnormal cell migration protein 18-like fibronectin type I domain-containing protein n=1 Tax=Necator americanus TaxID=51031 RepID=A0ABR1DRZ6_NECAM